jgi:YVTN family beta-propeller protein
MDRWRVAWLMPWGNGSERAWYAGDYNSGRVFRMEWTYPYEGADIFPRGLSPGVLAHDSNRVFLHTIRLDVEAGPTVEATAAESLVLSGALPDCAVGDTVSYQYTLTGGFSPFAWEVTAGALPDGLELDPETGLVTGVTTTAEHDNVWTITVTDFRGNPVTLDDGCYVMDMVGDPPDANNGDPYSYALTGTEGTSPYTFAKISGSLPTGATLSSAGLISGTLTEEDTFTFSVTMTDAAGVTQTKTYNIGVGITYGTIFVGSDDSSTGMNVVDGDTGTASNVGASTPVLWPTVSNDGARVYYLDPVGDTLNYLQLSDNTHHVLATSVPNNGGHPLIDSTGTYLWILDFDNVLLRKIRLSDGVEVNTYTTSTNCTHMCWKDSDKLVIYMSGYSGSGIYVFNTASPAAPSVLDPYGHGAGQGIGVDSSTGHIIQSTDNGVGWCVDICTAAGVAVWTSGSLALVTRQLAVTPDGAKAYVVADNTTPGTADGKVYVIDTAAHALVATITVGRVPNDIAINAAGSRAYVPCHGTGNLYVIDTASDTVIDTITTPYASHVGILEG